MLCNMLCDVKDEYPKGSPLVQGGLKILIEMSLVLDDAVKIKKERNGLIRKIRLTSKFMTSQSG